MSEPKEESFKQVLDFAELLSSVVEAKTPKYHAHSKVAYYCGDLD